MRALAWYASARWDTRGAAHIIPTHTHTHTHAHTHTQIHMHTHTHTHTHTQGARRVALRMSSFSSRDESDEDDAARRGESPDGAAPLPFYRSDNGTRESEFVGITRARGEKGKTGETMPRSCRTGTTRPAHCLRPGSTPDSGVAWSSACGAASPVSGHTPGSGRATKRGSATSHRQNKHPGRISCTCSAVRRRHVRIDAPE